MKGNLNGKVAVITGATSGIGSATAERFRAGGAQVVCVARRKNPAFDSFCADITDSEQIRLAFEAIHEKYGKIDILVNNAGGGISGSAEDTAAEDAERLFDLNFFGALNTVRTVIPYMREQGGGIIVNVGSVAAEFAIPFQSFYSASKAALSSFSYALRNELAPFHIKVSAVLPGDVKTNFTASRKKCESNPAYGDRAERAVAAMERDERNGMAPETVAKAIVGVAKSKKPPVKKIVGFKYKLFVALARFLPARLINYILGKMYA